MSTARAKTITSWVLVILLAAAYLIGALGKLTGAATQVFEGWGYAPWFATLIGVFEFSGAIGLLIPKLTRYAILGLSGILIGASYNRLRTKAIVIGKGRSSPRNPDRELSAQLIGPIQSVRLDDLDGAGAVEQLAADIKAHWMRHTSPDAP